MLLLILLLVLQSEYLVATSSTLPIVTFAGEDINVSKVFSITPDFSLLVEEVIAAMETPNLKHFSLNASSLSLRSNRASVIAGRYSVSPCCSYRSV